MTLTNNLNLWRNLSSGAPVAYRTFYKIHILLTDFSLGFSLYRGSDVTLPFWIGLVWVFKFKFETMIKCTVNVAHISTIKRFES